MVDTPAMAGTRRCHGIANEIWEVETRSLSSITEMRKKIREEVFLRRSIIKDCGSPLRCHFWRVFRGRIGFSSASVREFGVPLLYTDKVEIHTATWPT